MRKFGCFLVVLVLLAGAWFGYTRFYAPSAPTTVTTTAPVKLWQPLTPAKAERGRAALQSLSRPSGPVYANLTASEAASYIFLVVAKELPPSLKGAEAAVIGSRLYVRSEVDLKELGGTGALGALGAFLGPRDSVTLGGTINMLGPGRGEFLIQEVKIGRLDLPSGLIPRIVARIKPASRTPDVSSNGLPMKMPAYISDVRISNGKITVYKTTG
jgi:hypothetical protein